MGPRDNKATGWAGCEGIRELRKFGKLRSPKTKSVLRGKKN